MKYLILTMLIGCTTPADVTPDASMPSCGPMPIVPPQAALTGTLGPPATVTMPESYFQAVILYEVESRDWMACVSR